MSTTLERLRELLIRDFGIAREALEPRATLESLDAVHADLAKSIAAVSPARWGEEVSGDPVAYPSGTGVSHRALVHGLAQHDAYHTGQVALLKKLYRS